MREPVAHQFKAFRLQTVDPRAASLLVIEQTGDLEDAKMPRGGLPGVFEDGRDLTGGHGAVVDMQGHQHPSPGGVRQGTEDRFVGIDLESALTTRHAAILSHIAKYLSIDI